MTIDTDGMKRPTQIKGHALQRSWTGSHSGYANGRCECGEWYSKSWTNQMSIVVSSHREHLLRVKLAAIAKATGSAA